MRASLYIALGALSLALVGCQTPRTAYRPSFTGDPIVDGGHAITNGPAKDKVLWEYRMALASMRRGNFAEAKQLLDDAILRISNVLGKDPSARQARSYFSPEAKKTFIGEPYERVMAWYYRGILYWMDGEPDNARACFRSAALEDSYAEDKKYASDYVLLDYLDGYATTRLSGDGSDSFKRAETSAKISQPPPYEEKANLLVFADFGPGPIKYAVGEYNQQLMFRSGTTPVKSVQVQIAGKTYQLRPYDDLNFQATTRGGRVMDHILANKAGFKRTTDTAGNAAIIGGVAMAHADRDLAAAGLGVAAVGLISKLVSAGTTPEADTRSWDNLPLFLTFAALQVPPGDHEVVVDFLDSANRLMPHLSKKLTVSVPAGKTEKVIYVSDKSQTPQRQ